MSKPRIHLAAVAGPCRALLNRLNMRSCKSVVRLVQSAVGADYTVTATPALMDPWFDEHRGGRRDDRARCRDINKVFADDGTTAMVALRGGAWLTRLLPHINFEALRTRRTPLHVFGFSEFTTLINIAARYPRVRAWYEHDLGHLHARDGDYRAAVRRFMADLVGVMSGRGSSRELRGRLVQGTLGGDPRIRVAGGCLTVMPALLGSPFGRCLTTRGRWLAMEDIHNDPYGIDRQLAHLKVGGVFERCAGLLIGDFHLEDIEAGIEDQTQTVLELLKYHLPANRRLPVVAYANFGHCHPSAPLPINRPIRLCREPGGRQVRLEF